MLPAVENPVLQSATTILETSFPDLLQALLDERGVQRAQLYDYIFEHGCHIDQTAMYRYFNPNPATNRLPAGKNGERFLELLAAFLGLSGSERAALRLVWQIQRRQRRKNGFDRIEIMLPVDKSLNLHRLRMRP